MKVVQQNYVGSNHEHERRRKFLDWDFAVTEINPVASKFAIFYLFKEMYYLGFYVFYLETKNFIWCVSEKGTPF